MKEIKALIEPSPLCDVVVALRGMPSMPESTVTDVRLFLTRPVLQAIERTTSRAPLIVEGPSSGTSKKW